MAGLTAREVEIVRLLVRGLTAKAIAGQLVISPLRRITRWPSQVTPTRPPADEILTAGSAPPYTTPVDVNPARLVLVLQPHGEMVFGVSA